MPRIIKLAAAQLGPIARSESRGDVVARLIELLREAAAGGCQLVVFPECALTAFFPHWWIDDAEELDVWFERQMPSPATRVLFDEATRLGVAFCIGYAELAEADNRARHFNTSILVDSAGTIVGKYRKVHLPGHVDHRPDNPFQNLEKRYFEVGDLGFPVWRMLGGIVGMLICNDRRWPEAYRCLALQGAELILLGYNTPRHVPEFPELDRLAPFHHLLSMQAGAYQSGAWVVGVAKAGVEEGVDQLGLSAIIAPSGEIVAQSQTVGDELLVHDCDLDLTRPYKEMVFNYAQHRRPEHYGRITGQAGSQSPTE